MSKKKPPKPEPQPGDVDYSPTSQELVDQCNELAQLFYRMRGYMVPTEYKMYEATHPHEVEAWNAAVLAYDHIQGVDIEACLSDYE
jgi:hypothetical protein